MKVFGYFPGCEDFDVNHKDGDHANFRLSNLEFLTPYDNVKRVIENGLVQ